ncbi:relaxase/mobilization nuclease domain-containing protein [Porticoccus sp. GXU_MW_L64]
MGNATGFIGQSPYAAFQEIEAISKGTQAKQPFFHVVFNPPNSKLVSNDQFYDAIDRLEKKLGLVGQPRYPIFHDKGGQRHCHCVWSRIDIDKMKAINMAFFKDKCFQLSRDLFKAYSWENEMPAGFIDKEKKDPFDVFIGEFRRLQKQGVDPREIKQICQEAWLKSYDMAGFKKRLEEQSFFLAQGDKRGFVVVDENKKVYSLSRFGGIRVRDLKARLGSPTKLPSVSSILNRIRTFFNADIRRQIRKLKQQHENEIAPLKIKKDWLIATQRLEREKVENKRGLKKRFNANSSKSHSRKEMRLQFNKVRGVNNQHDSDRNLKHRFKRETKNSSRQLMVFRQNLERAKLQKELSEQKKRQFEERMVLAKDIYDFRQVKPKGNEIDSSVLDAFEPVSAEDDISAENPSKPRNSSRLRNERRTKKPFTRDLE